jgi:hypothetical protein
MKEKSGTVIEMGTSQNQSINTYLYPLYTHGCCLTVVKFVIYMDARA